MSLHSGLHVHGETDRETDSGGLEGGPDTHLSPKKETSQGNLQHRYFRDLTHTRKALHDIMNDDLVGDDGDDIMLGIYIMLRTYLPEYGKPFYRLVKHLARLESALHDDGIYDEVING